MALLLLGAGIIATVTTAPESGVLTAGAGEQVMELVVFDEARALKMLVASTDKIAVAHVLAQLKGHGRLTHAYLDMLFDKDPRAGANFHELQVELYADFDQVACARACKRAKPAPIDQPWPLLTCSKLRDCGARSLLESKRWVGRVSSGGILPRSICVGAC